MRSPELLGSELDRVAAIEAHTVRAWPATFVETTADGWVLRATPDLNGRGRSNHALVPASPLTVDEYRRGLSAAAAFASAHTIPCGVQVSPIDRHRPLLEILAGLGWTIGEEVVVMTAETGQVGRGAAQGLAQEVLELSVTDAATRDWVDAWSHCDRRADVDAHVQSVFRRMAGVASFAHAQRRAAGISVEIGGIVGLFCIAVAPEERRQGLGRRLVQAMLARHAAPLTYLQVFSRNAAGRALYSSLGFRDEYRYCHCVAPPAEASSLPDAGAARTAPASAAVASDGC